MIQISALSSRELQLVNITNLVQAFKTDFDLALLEHDKIPEIKQTVYVVRGSNYVSFFSGLSTAGSSHSNTAGTLADT